MFARNFSIAVAVSRKSNPDLSWLLLICIKLISAELQLVALGADIVLLAAAKASEALRLQLSLEMNHCQLLLSLMNLWM